MPSPSARRRSRKRQRSAASAEKGRAGHNEGGTGLSDELIGVSAATLTGRIRRREISPVEVLEGVIRQIERRNPSINGMVVFGFDDARKEAKRAEQAVMSGAKLGPLHGLPVAMKDCFDFKPGWVTTFGGIRAMRNYVAKTACTFVERAEAAGAIVIGKTNSPIFGFRGTCDNYMFGPSRNPFNLAKNTGGSSGGSGAIVADGLLPLAEGTDGGGRSASRPRGAASMATRRRSGGCHTTPGNAFGAPPRSCSKAR